MTPVRWFWLAAAVSLAVDLASKMFVFEILGGGPPPDGVYSQDHMVWLLPSAFRLICHYNTGGAFGWAAGNVLLFLAANAVLVPILVMTAYHCRDPESPLWALGLIVGGAVGNLYDRLFHVGVRDFLEVVNPGTGTSLWPVFNIADIAIVAGVGVYLVWSVAGAYRGKARTENVGE
ncbi:MAG: signal peptidase II [Planctomycetota bacterium]|jgi:signal peptidase II|nr:signal peptidase II [Planctomycetota bacterium]